MPITCVSADTPLLREAAERSLQVFGTNDGQRLLKLINSWFDAAWEDRAAKAEDSFEPFIRSWIAFNCWGNYVTDKEQDAEVIKELCRNPVLRDDFERLLATDRQFAVYAKRFHRQWPIFSVMYMREVDLNIRQIWDGSNPYPSRKGLIARYMRAVVNKRSELAALANQPAPQQPKSKRMRDDIFRPRCWELHTGYALGDLIGDNSRVPLDWPHTLHAIYVVRCNLFHGAKSRYSDADAKLVLYAFQVLAYFIHSGSYFSESWRPTSKQGARDAAP